MFRLSKLSNTMSLIARLWLFFALLMATDAVCLGIDSVRVDTKQAETNVAVFFDGNPDFSSIHLDAYNNFLEIKIYDAVVGRDTPVNMAGMSEFVKGVEVMQRGRSAVVRLETEGDAEFIKEAAKMGRYQDQLMLTVDHLLISKLRESAKQTPMIASKERIFDFTFYTFLVAMLCLAIVFKGRHATKSINSSTRMSSSRLKMQTLATIPPTKTHQLSMVEIGNQKLLIANGPGGVQLLTAFPQASSMTSYQESPEKLQLIQQLQQQIKQKMLEKDSWGHKS